MSLDAHLIHRCTIERPTVTQADPYQQSVVTYAAVVEDAPCRLVTKLQRMMSDDRIQFTVVTRYQLFVTGEIDAREGDRISGLVMEDRTTLAGVFEVSAILPRRSRHRHHLTLELEQVT